jgi:hypothetical protein
MTRAMPDHGRASPHPRGERRWTTRAGPPPTARPCAGGRVAPEGCEGDGPCRWRPCASGRSLRACRRRPRAGEGAARCGHVSRWHRRDAFPGGSGPMRPAQEARGACSAPERGRRASRMERAGDAFGRNPRTRREAMAGAKPGVGGRQTTGDVRRCDPLRVRSRAACRAHRIRRPHLTDRDAGIAIESLFFMHFLAPRDAPANAA